MSDFDLGKSELFVWVNLKVFEDPKKWYVGITNDLDRRSKEHLREFNLKNLPEFDYLVTNDLDEAQEVERVFTKEIGTKGNTGGDLDKNRPISLYVFRVK